ncbi:glycosyltransferase [Rhizorhabdus dicambivorans]|uniref:Histidine kinase n=1 Tax=Rhizorhabdus dicambivorans TaxID=1850238 RepID=A0A2A4FSI7_9SPHN|nr:glycosyltransferase [Rhizorhabdus dicambivorans]ATE64598.1 histidine kinase [Rhizorhabdus dicambivorans]PCE41695.1 histidine kinase [Rhizorhabdus dicambivorans]
MITILALLSAVLLLLFLHPYISYPLSLLLFRERPVRRGAGPRPHSASLFFAAYNEERALPAKLANVAEIKALHPATDVVAYSDMSADRTLEMLSARPDLLRVVPSTERTGKATGMRRMVATSYADICIFTDANVLLDPVAVDRLLDYFSDPEVGGVAGTLRYINDADSLTAEVSGLYWRLEEWIKRRESHCGSIMGADGSIFATRRHLYPEVPPHLLDDMTVSMSTTFAGYRLIHAADVVAYEKNATASADEFRRKRRIACRAFNTHRHLWPQIWRSYGAADIYKYVSHKLLRWLGLPILALSGLCATAALLLAGQAGWALALWAAAAATLLLARAHIRPFGQIGEIFLSISAIFVGLTDSWRGQTYQTWAPAKSRD